MGIHFVCHLCSYALHVKDFQAGKRGKCPNCQGSFRIPATDASYSSAVVTPTLDIEDSSNSVNKTIVIPALSLFELDAKWFVRPPSGGQFGPAPSQLLVSWIAESRVTGDSYLWRDGLAQWQLARELLPELFVNEKPGMAILPSPGLNEITFTDRSDANKNSEINLAVSSTLTSGAMLKKRLQKRRQQITMIILLASISLILLSILIFVLIFQVAKPLPAAFLDRTKRIGQSEVL